MPQERAPKSKRVGLKRITEEFLGIVFSYDYSKSKKKIGVQREREIEGGNQGLQQSSGNHLRPHQDPRHRRHLGAGRDSRRGSGPARNYPRSQDVDWVRGVEESFQRGKVFPENFKEVVK
jgi:hypothetical protein